MTSGRLYNETLEPPVKSPKVALTLEEWGAWHTGVCG